MRKAFWIAGFAAVGIIVGLAILSRENAETRRPMLILQSGIEELQTPTPKLTPENMPSSPVEKKTKIKASDAATVAAPSMPDEVVLAVEEGITSTADFECMGSTTAIAPKIKSRCGALSKSAERDRFYDRAEASYRIPSTAGNDESYETEPENSFQSVSVAPLSTFSIDVDTASYANTRRMLRAGVLPPPAAIRLEEFINYFDYKYAPPTDGKPFATHISAVACPWSETNQLVRIGLKGKLVQRTERPASSLVFLLDVSGSMSSANKLPLVIDGMKMLVEQLSAQDRVAIVVYAGSSGLVLPSTLCSEKRSILDALERLSAGGSTNGGEGIKLAYATAAASFIKEGINRVILCTDGDFNVGMTERENLTEYIKKKAAEKVFLTVLGFGMGNLKDATLEKLADNGNGNYGYIDNIKEAKKLFVEQLSGTLVTIAKDVKIQVEFNPARIQAYRLIGYENRKLKDEDFNNDKKDAGEIGAGHTVTALYEVVPAGARAVAGRDGVDPLKYQPAKPEDTSSEGEILTVKLRYKEPEGETSRLLEFPFRGPVMNWTEGDIDTRFATGVAAFGMLLKKSALTGAMTFPQVTGWVESTIGEDPNGYRAEFLGLVRQAASLNNQ